MGIPEERLKRVDFASKMDAAMDAKRAAMMKSAATGSEARSPLSSLSNTDSDDSVDVRVRSPAQPKYRKRPRDSVASDAASEARTESDASDSERAAKRAADGFVVPKKRFRRDYEAAARLQDEKSDDGESDGGGRERDEVGPVPGCARHRQVVFECAACLEGVAKRFGWPAHALRSPAAPPPLPLPLPVLPQLTVPFAPFVDPLMAFRALGGDPRVAAGLLASAAPPRPASVTPLRRTTPPAAARPAPPPAPQEEAPLDLTRRTSSSSSSSSGGSSGSGGRFSIENILAGRTAAAEHPAERGLAPCSAAASLSPPLGASAKKSAPSPGAGAAPRRTVLPPHGGERRELANERERMRVKHLTGAFKELSASIGGIASECIGTTGVKFTKVAILRTASLYIGYLSHLLSEGPGATEEKVYDQMRSAVLEVMTSKSKKSKDDEDDEEEM